MCDVKKYNDIFNEINKLTKDDTMQLILESPTEEAKDFYAMIGDYLLQKKPLFYTYTLYSLIPILYFLIYGR